MIRPWAVFLAVLFFTGAAMPSAYSAAQKPQKASSEMLDDKRLEGLVSAPDFPENLEWLNTSRPISLKELRGKMVLLDFWTFCCINCIHVLPDLKKLEEKYPNELVVIGVHSAKFLNEKGTESIRQAILRYEIKHPVVNDKDLDIWQEYGIRSWPTLVLINPNGRIIGIHSGEGVYSVFDPILSQSIRYFEQKRELKKSPFKIVLEESKRQRTLLAFPGKISADNLNKRLFISDSNHNRILISDEQGKVLDVIGSGRQGSEDGSFEASGFHHPQGTFLEGDTLYIADTENHLIRAADLKTRTVTTLWGTGEQAQAYNFSGRGKSAALNSPWDLLSHDGKLYVAMAGAHQLYAADLKTQEIKPHAGSGREARVDGPLAEAALAQPSGITTDGAKLYFADSEVSSIRSADIDPRGKVETLIGEDLFEFGDVDGSIQDARLQHALGVTYHEGLLYIADTYNSKIKIIDPFKKTSVTFSGTGKHGFKDGEKASAQFFEPGGLAILGGRLYVADTNNHAVRVIDLKSGQVNTLEITGIDKMAGSQNKKEKARVITLPAQQVGIGRGELRFAVKIPKGYKQTPGVSPQIVWRSEDAAVLTFEKKPEDFSEIRFPLMLEFQASSGKTQVTAEAIIYYCREDATICYFDQIKLQLPVETQEAGLNHNLTADLEIMLKEPKKS